MGYYWGMLFDILFFFYLFLTLISIVLTLSKTFYTNFGKAIMENWFDYNFKDDTDFKNHFLDFNRYFAFIMGFVIFLIMS